METPIGVMDSANREFTISRSDLSPYQLKLYLNGGLQLEGVDFSLAGDVITYAVPPDALDWHEADLGASGTGSGSTTTNNGYFYRTLLLRDLTIGTDIADHEVIYLNRRLIKIIGWIKRPIESDLSVKFYSIVEGVDYEVCTFTIPVATPINSPIDMTLFNFNNFPGRSLLKASIVASDGSIHKAGTAGFTFVFYGLEGSVGGAVSNHAY